jgi:hypothetical protein
MFSVMTDRRRQARAVFLAPAQAHIEIVNDAIVESWSHNRLVVITTRSASVGDQFVMQTNSQGGLQSWEATVVSCEPVISESPLRHRLSLSLTPPPPPANDTPVTVM